MDTIGGITPTYSIDNNGFGGGGLWLFAILALMWGGFGGNRFGNYDAGRNAFAERCATVEDLNNSANFTRLDSQVRANENYIQQGFNNVGNGIASLGYEVAQQFGNTNMALTNGFGQVKYDTLAQTSALSNQVSECCCANKQLLMENRYLNSQEVANQTTTIMAGIQKVLDGQAQNKIEALQAKVNELQLAQATGNVVRYPVSSTYTAGTNPFCNCNCGCGNI